MHFETTKTLNKVYKLLGIKDTANLFVMVQEKKLS